jgi:hypothetical protein
VLLLSHSLGCNIEPSDNDLLSEIMYCGVQELLTRTTRVDGQNVFDAVNQLLCLPFRSDLSEKRVDARRNDHLRCWSGRYEALCHAEHLRGDRGQSGRIRISLQ